MSDTQKRNAGEAAALRVEAGMVVGLGMVRQGAGGP
jgi:ribose 5-phosphate isomerase